MNPYPKAIERQEARQFLLGHGDYFYLDRDWGVHDVTRTGGDLLDYALLYGEDTLYSQLNKDLSAVLSDETITTDELLSLISYIWIYFQRKRNGHYKKDWIISNDVKQQIKNQIMLKMNQHQNLVNVVENLEQLKNNFGFSLDAPPDSV